MIEVFKIITHNIYDPDVPLYLNWNITRTVAIEVININLLITHFTIIYENTIFFCTHR